MLAWCQFLDHPGERDARLVPGPFQATGEHLQLLAPLTKCKHLSFPAAANWFGNIYVSVDFKAKNSAGMFKSNSILAVRNAPVILKLLLKMFTFLKLW